MKAFKVFLWCWNNMERRSFKYQWFPNWIIVCYYCKWSDHLTQCGEPKNIFHEKCLALCLPNNSLLLQSLLFRVIAYQVCVTSNLFFYFLHVLYIKYYFKIWYSVKELLIKLFWRINLMKSSNKWNL